MAKGLLIVIGATAAVSVAVGGSMSSDHKIVAVEQAVPAVDDREPSEQGSVAEPAPDLPQVDKGVELDRSADGHFYADVRINGADVHALVDTGASRIALSRNDARNAGLATSLAMNEVVGRGADGDVFGERVTLNNVTLGHRSVEGLEAIVLNSGEQTLLGQNFLTRFDSVEIRGDTMVLR